MEADFQKYLRNFLKRYQIDPAGIDFNCVSDYQSMLNQLEGHTPNLSTILHPLEVIFDLHKKGIYIYKDKYKTSKRYLQEKDDWIHINENEITSTENYIERFLLDKPSLLDVYEEESIYAMGNPYEFDDKECKLAEILMQDEDDSKYAPKDDERVENINFNSDKSISAEIKELNLDLIKMLLRPSELDFTSSNGVVWGGLVSRLRHSLKFDIKKFPATWESRAEICKIIYFFLKLEHTPFVPTLQGKKPRCNKRNRHEPFFSATNFLGVPSMESIGYAYLRRKTYNGKITDYLKNELEKELYLKENPSIKVDDIKIVLHRVSNTWEELVKKIRHVIDTNEKIDFDQIDVILDAIINKPKAPTYKEIKRCYGQKTSPESFDYTYKFSPIEILYLKVLQFERLGEIEGKIWVNDVEINANYDVPKEFVERMITCKSQFIGSDLKTYLRKNRNYIAECVYLKLHPTEREKRRIGDNIEKLNKLLGYCTYFGRMIEPNNEISALLVISCLQVILFDRADGEYGFYDYEYHLENTAKPKVRIPTPNGTEKSTLMDQIPLDPIKLCLARMVEEHWYANIGKHEQFCRLREFESKVYEILSEKIYTISDVFAMENRSREYCDRLMESGI